jgi:hypothetical protein
MSLTLSLNHPTPKEIISINQELSRSKLPPYNYDKNIVPTDIKFPNFCWPSTDRYHYNNLKIISAKLWQDPSWITDKDFVNFANYQYQTSSEIEFAKYILEEAIAQEKSHLICLERDCGSYIPIDFGSVELPLWSIRRCGSSVNLCRELEFIASSLQFDLDRHHPYLSFFKEWDKEYKKEIKTMYDEDILMGEKRILSQLYNIAFLSVKYNLIVKFN